MLPTRMSRWSCQKLRSMQPATLCPAVTAGRVQVVPRKLTGSAQSETEGVQQLLARDRGSPQSQKADVPSTSGEQADAPSSSPQPTSTSSSQRNNRSVLKSKRQRRKELAKMDENSGEATSTLQQEEEDAGPKRCGQALNLGLQLFEQKQYHEAIEMFSLALELPGNGACRMPGSPREYSCPSDAEENAALYNMACAYAQLQQPAAAMTCLEAVLENGFEDFDTIRNDADLAPCRGTQLDVLLSKFDSPLAKVQKMLKGPDRNQSDTNKPWLLW